MTEAVEEGYHLGIISRPYSTFPYSVWPGNEARLGFAPCTRIMISMNTLQDVHLLYKNIAVYILHATYWPYCMDS